MKAIIPYWGELWPALAADDESAESIVASVAYGLGSDYIDDVQCTVQEDDTIRLVMYDQSERMSPVVLHEVTIRLEYMKERGQPEWSMIMLRM